MLPLLDLISELGCLKAHCTENAPGKKLKENWAEGVAENFKTVTLVLICLFRHPLCLRGLFFVLLINSFLLKNIDRVFHLFCLPGFSFHIDHEN